MNSNPLKKLNMKKYKKGLWSPDEDHKLRDYILNHGYSSWTSIAINAGLQRNGKSCRLRWINYLKPGIKRGFFTIEDEEIILSLHCLFGNKWSLIAQHLHGRTDNEIKNHWHSYLKKKVAATSEKHKKKVDSSCSSMMLTQNSSYDSSEPSTTEELVFDSTKEAGNGILPKVLFSEWLSLDQFNEQGFDNLNKSATSSDSFEDYPNFEDTFIHDLLLNQESFAICDDFNLGNGML